MSLPRVMVVSQVPSLGKSDDVETRMSYPFANSTICHISRAGRGTCMAL